MVRRYVTLASSQVTIQHRKFSPMDRLTMARTETPLSATGSGFLMEGWQFGRKQLSGRSHHTQEGE